MSKNGSGINDDDLSLWERFIDGIKPLKKRDSKPPATTSPPKQKPSSQKTAHIPLGKNTRQRVSTTPEPNAGNNNLDRKTLNKLKGGKMAIEGTIDLHDKTQEQAYNALKGFVTRAFQSQKRCVLVITGKGKRTKTDDIYTSQTDGIGVLKSRLPDWVSQPPLNQMVLRYMPAHKKHGGGGAFYLYLKRQRTP